MSSRAARWALGLRFTADRVYTIPMGPLRGLKVRFQPAMTYHAMLGLYELRNFKCLDRLVQGQLIAPGDVVCDVGANVGLFALWFATRCAPQGKVHAIEAAPATAAMLRDTIAINGVSNIEVGQYACTDRSGPVEFFVGADHHTSSLDPAWAGSVLGPATTVEGISLDDYFFGVPSRTPPALIKMDIEGAGRLALAGAERCFQTRRPLVFIESHTPEEDRAICDTLARHDYDAFRVNDGRWVAQPSEVHPHPAGVWGTLLLCPRELRDVVARLLQ